MNYVEDIPYVGDPPVSPSIGESWWHVVLWGIFGAGFCLIPTMLVLGEKTPATYLVSVGLWVGILVLMVRRTRSRRRALTARSALIEKRSLESKAAIEKHLIERQVAWPLTPETQEARRMSALKKAADERVAKAAKDRQFAEWDQKAREEKAKADLAAEYKRSRAPAPTPGQPTAKERQFAEWDQNVREAKAKADLMAEYKRTRHLP